MIGCMYDRVQGNQVYVAACSSLSLYIVIPNKIRIFTTQATEVIYNVHFGECSEYGMFYTIIDFKQKYDICILLTRYMVGLVLGNPLYVSFHSAFR